MIFLFNKKFSYFTPHCVTLRLCEILSSTYIYKLIFIKVYMNSNIMMT
jgi:hypothetical protein